MGNNRSFYPPENNISSPCTEVLKKSHFTYLFRKRQYLSFLQASRGNKLHFKDRREPRATGGVPTA